MLSNLDLLNRDLPKNKCKINRFCKNNKNFQNTPLYKLWETFKDFYKT